MVWVPVLAFLARAPFLIWHLDVYVAGLATCFNAYPANLKHPQYIRRFNDNLKISKPFYITFICPFDKNAINLHFISIFRRNAHL